MSKIGKRKLSPRAERRAQGRDGAKLARDRERLARMDAGGAPEHPIEVDSASQVDVHALSLLCPRCEGTCRIDEHAAVTLGGTRLRVAHMRCAQCGTKRDVYFRILSALPS
jgi:hypothetical protein